MTKYKILFVDHTPFIGGAQLALLRHLKYLNRQFFTPLVVCSASKAPLLNLLKEQKVKIVTIPFARFKAFSPSVFWRFFRTFFSLLLVVKREKPDLIVSNTERAVYPAFLVAKISRRPLVFWVRDFEYSRPLLRFLARAADRSIFVSRAVRDYYGFNGSAKAGVVYVGTNMQVSRPEGSAPADPSGLRLGWGLGENDIAIGFAGRLVSWKGAQIVLQAAKMLKDEHFFDKRWKVIIAGEGSGQAGENTQELKDYVRQQRLEAVVDFVGFQKEIGPFYEALDIFVHSSLKPEPFATVVVEAMAAGLPVVAAAVGGTSEIIKDGENGLFFPLGNAVALAEKLKRLLSDEALRRRLGAAAQRTVQQSFTEEAVTRQMEQVYEEVLGRKGDAV